MKTVFKAVMAAAPNIDGLSLDGADEISGRLTFKAGVSLASWGENISVQLISLAPTQTKLQVLSTPKTGIMFGGANDFGKNRINIEKIISAVSKELSNMPQEVGPTQQTSTTSKADELLKLKELKDSGILSEEEFESEKKKILANDNIPTGAPKVTAQSAPSAPQQISETPVHIEGSGSSPNTVAIIAGVVFIFILIMIFAGM